MSMTNSWDETQPTNSTNATSIDDEIRKVRLDVRERMGVDHWLESSDTGENERGIHTRISIRQPLSTQTPTQNNQSIIYRNSSDGARELRHVVKDANGITLQDKIVFVGEVKFWLGLEANIPVGWLPLKGSTVGNTGSGATYAGTVYQDLYYHLWNNLDNTAAPVSTGRGASAAADFTALKTITMPDGRSKMPIGAGQASGMTLRKEGYVGGGETKDLEHTHGLGTLSVPAHNHQWYQHNSGAVHESFAENGTEQNLDSQSTTNKGIILGTGAAEERINADQWTDNEAAATPTGTLADGGSATQDVMNPWIAIWMIIKY